MYSSSTAHRHKATRDSSIGPRASHYSIIAVVLTMVLVLTLGFRSQSEIAQAIQVIKSVPMDGFWLAVVIMPTTFVAAAMAYYMLALKSVPMQELLIVELAAAAVNRLVPAGIGSLGAHGLYLHARQHTVAEATAVISVNNLIGAVMHLAVLSVALLMTPGGQFHPAWPQDKGWILLGFGLLVVGCSAVKPFRRVTIRFTRNLLASYARYEGRWQRLIYAAAALLALTMGNMLILFLASHSFDVSLSFSSLFIIYSASVFLGSVVPTPGGLGAVEAGLVGGFVAFGIGAPTAIAIALAFRVVTYWLPIIPGLIALAVCRHRHLL
ncbi:UPF0104 family protein [Candidatus Saccharibacteria bacterium]|nr:UPF0104 family protein [Candidatus Saccharibacteria bacterium]